MQELVDELQETPKVNIPNDDDDGWEWDWISITLIVVLALCLICIVCMGRGGIYRVLCLVLDKIRDQNREDPTPEVKTVTEKPDHTSKSVEATSSNPPEITTSKLPNRGSPTDIVEQYQAYITTK